MTIKSIDDIRDSIQRKKLAASPIDELTVVAVVLTGAALAIGAAIGVTSTRFLLNNDSAEVAKALDTLENVNASEYQTTEAAKTVGLDVAYVMSDFFTGRQVANGRGDAGYYYAHESMQKYRGLIATAEENAVGIDHAIDDAIVRAWTGWGMFALGLMGGGILIARRRRPSQKRLKSVDVSEKELLDEAKRLLEADRNIVLMSVKTTLDEREAAVKDNSEALAICRERRDAFAEGTAQRQEAERLVEGYEGLLKSVTALRDEAQRVFDEREGRLNKLTELRLGEIRLALISERNTGTFDQARTRIADEGSGIDATALSFDTAARITGLDPVGDLESLVIIEDDLQETTSVA